MYVHIKDHIYDESQKLLLKKCGDHFVSTPLSALPDEYIAPSRHYGQRSKS